MNLGRTTQGNEPHWPKSYQAASVPNHFPGCPLHCSARTNCCFSLVGTRWDQEVPLWRHSGQSFFES
jgi:hypothetical protein